jgi:hypothetical protein
MKKACPEGRIWFSAVGESWSLFMGVFGISIRALIVDLLGCLNPDSTFGAQSFEVIASVMSA